MKIEKTKSKKSQAWGIDLMAAMVIFSIGIVAFYIYSLNQPGEAKENIEELFYDGNIIADSILSEGYPEDWQAEDVITIGILNQDKINETKLERFYNLAETNYPLTKQIFNTKYNYYVFLSEPMIINSMEIEGIGLKPSNSENLVKITRFVVYKNKPTTMSMYIWE